MARRLDFWIRASIFGMAMLFLAGVAMTGALAQGGSDTVQAHDDHQGAVDIAPEEGNPHSGHESTSCEPTADQLAAADALVASTTDSLLAFPTPEEAEAAGYEPFRGDGAVSGQGWNSTWHYVNWVYMEDDGTLDPARIESIIYGLADDGDARAIGAMYVMPRGESGPQVGGCLTTWHTHTLGNITTAEMMHVWTTELSVGPFAHQGSPYYACEALGQTGIGSGYTVAPPDCQPQPFDIDARREVVGEVADFLGLTRDELRTEIASGETLVTLADGAGITRDELNAFLVTVAEGRLNRAVSNGELTEDQADVILTRVEEQFENLLDGS